MFESELFRKQIYCIEESNFDNVAILGAWGIALPLPPRCASGFAWRF